MWKENFKSDRTKKNQEVIKGKQNNNSEWDKSIQNFKSDGD